MTVRRQIGITLVTVITTMWLIHAHPAAAQLSTRMNAVETSPRFIILPVNAHGMMTFQACSTICEDVPHQRVQLTPDTRFTVNGKAVKFAEFRSRFATIRRKDASFALVSYYTASNAVKQLDIAG